MYVFHYPITVCSLSHFTFNATSCVLALLLRTYKLCYRLHLTLPSLGNRSLTKTATLYVLSYNMYRSSLVWDLLCRVDVVLFMYGLMFVSVMLFLQLCVPLVYILLHLWWSEWITSDTHLSLCYEMWYQVMVVVLGMLLNVWRSLLPLSWGSMGGNCNFNQA